MATFDLSNFVIDRVIRGVMTSTDNGDLLWSVNQMTNPSISCTSETTDATDMLGSTIMQFERSKAATFSAENSLFDLGLAAAQFGTQKEVASTSAKILTPKFETIDIKTGYAPVVLSEKPKNPVTAIYGLNGDSSLGTKYTSGASASATQFVYSAEDHQITLPTGLVDGSQILVMYEYEAENAVAVTNSATNFPKAGKFVVEVLGADVCNPSVLYYAYLIFPQAKLSSNVDLTFTTDGTHPFEITCMPEYCNKEKRLFQIIVPEA